MRLDKRLRAAPCVSFHKVSVANLKCLSKCVEFSRSTRTFASFTKKMIGNETGPLNKFVDLSRKLINTCGTWHMLKRVIASSLKILYEDFTSVKSYGKTNLNIFVLRLWEKYRWDLTSFGQFINTRANKQMFLRQYFMKNSPRVTAFTRNVKCLTTNTLFRVVRLRHCQQTSDGDTNNPIYFILALLYCTI